MNRYTIIDADEGLFLSQELEAMKSRDLDVMYPDLMGRRLFPVDSTTGEGAETMAYRSYDMAGMAKIIANGSDDLPSVTVKSKKTVKQLYSIGDSFEYTQQDIRSARMGAVPLDSKMLSAARRAAMKTEDDLIFDGDSRIGYDGILAYPNISSVDAPDGAAGQTNWCPAGAYGGKTPDEIVDDVALAVNTIIDGSKGVEAPSTMALPTKQYGHIAQTRMGDGSDVTILNFILQSNPYISEIVPVYKLKDSIPADAAIDSEDCALIYERNPDKVWIEAPMDFRAYAPQEDGLKLKVPCEMRTGGVVVAYPLSVCRLDGI